MARDLDNFRVLVVLALATMGLATYIGFVAPGPAAEHQEILLWLGYGEVLPGYISYYWYWVEQGLYFIALATMFFFWRFSRQLILVALLLSPLRSGLGGIWVSSPVEDAFWMLHWVFVMLTVGMALFQPTVRAAFSAPQESVAV
jgi:nitroreductase